jgi:hypothetical protein
MMVLIAIALWMAIAGCTDTGSTEMQNNPILTGGSSGAAGVGVPSGGAGGMSGVPAGAGGASGAGASGAAGMVATPGGAGGAGGMEMAGAGGAGGMEMAGAGGAGGMEMAGAGGAGGMEMAGGAGGAGGMEMPPVDHGEGDGSDVVTIGDSWMSYLVNGGGIEGALDRAGTSYRHYGVAGTTLGSSIPPQWDSAKRANPNIKTVIMTGGGNDIMFSGGCSTKEACEAAVQMIADMLDELWTQMSNDGVQDVVYIQYSKNAGTTPAENRPTTSPTPSICIRGPLRCHSISTTDEVGPGDTVDGIHPTRAACDRIATKVLQVMEEQGVRR